ncbi:hypothetical protein [Domibacillus sp. A3M-37]|uniref:hypothetical protein n=1 Tax=Domibacillus sp. A3M-37 TaxID=2962037 RepID=UPI000AC5CC92
MKDLTIHRSNCCVDDWGLRLLLTNKQVKKDEVKEKIEVPFTVAPELAEVK